MIFPAYYNHNFAQLRDKVKVQFAATEYFKVAWAAFGRTYWNNIQVKLLEQEVTGGYACSNSLESPFTYREDPPYAGEIASSRDACTSQTAETSKSHTTPLCLLHKMSGFGLWWLAWMVYRIMISLI